MTILNSYNFNYRFPAKIYKAIFACIMLCSISLTINAQNQKQKLQNQYNKIQKELKEIENLLQTTKQEKSNSLEQLSSIKSKITTRQGLINNIKEQVYYLNDKIQEKEAVINALEKDIEQLKKDYAVMITNAYNNKYKSNYLSFIFNAESFNQAMQRMVYLQSYARTRNNQSKLIENTIADLNVKITSLKEDKANKETLLGEEVNQKEKLQQEENEKNTLIAKLKNDESKLQQQAKDKNKAAQELNNQIQKIIEEEIRLAKEKAAKEAKAKGGTSTTSSGMALTPEEKLISTDFVNNRGKLPWPVSKGFIISRFGKHEHPTLPNVYTNNNGVDIKTEKDATVRALFNGTVVNSFYLPATQNSVIVKHGEYFTVYSNLKTVSVKAGDNIVTKQQIGTVYTDSGTSKVHLEIWKGTEKTNPELWLAK